MGAQACFWFKSLQHHWAPAASSLPYCLERYFIMGGAHSIDMSVPTGGALLYVQKPECFAQPSFSESKPPTLSMIPDSSWQTFHSKVGAAASKMWTGKLALIGLVFFPALLIAPIALARSTLFLPVHLLVVGIFIAGIVGPRMIVVSHNQAQDAVIQQACSELASACGMSVQYRTAYTGFIKPKGAVPYRAIAISPNGAYSVGHNAPVAGQLMSVQVPAGASPGTSLQVQSPSGQQVQVVVPAGASAGQVFQVQVPAPVPVVVNGTVGSGLV